MLLILFFLNCIFSAYVLELMHFVDFENLLLILYVENYSLFLGGIVL